MPLFSEKSAGRLSAKECSFSRGDAEAQSFKTNYSYDNFDRITKVSSPAGEYAYTYDSKGRILSLSCIPREALQGAGSDLLASAGDRGGYTVTNTYDQVGRLLSKTFSDNSRNSHNSLTTLCSYVYDKLDRRIKAEVNGVKWDYGYDKLNQLTSASSSDGYVYGYGFDKIGNRMFASLMDKGTEKFKTDFEYNGLNQIASQGFEYDKYGNLTKAKDAEYSYDLHNRLYEVRKGDLTVKYSYDPLGQRIKSEELTTKDTKHTKKVPV